MSNRNEHRAARSRKLILVDIGRLQPRDPNYGLQLGCYVCATSHAASGCARIQDGPSETYVPLCDACYADDDTNRIVRTFLKAPDIRISNGGEVSTEQIEALVERQDKVEH